jgi:WD40-like Beta Propeller Repeat
MAPMVRVLRRRAGTAVALLALLLGACGSPGRGAGAGDLIVSNRSGAWRLYALDPAGGTARLLGAGGDDGSARDDAQPARPPDGTIVFASVRAGHSALYRVDADGTGARPLFASAASDSDPAPLGRDRIVFARDDGGGGRDLYAARLDGSDLVRLTRHPADDGAPCALPDGRTVVFESGRLDRPRIFRLDARAADPEAGAALLLPEGALGAGVTIDAETAPLCLGDGAVVMALALSGRPAQLFEFATSKGRSGLRQITEAAILPYGAGEPVAAADGGILLTAGPLPEGRRPRFSVYGIARGGYNLARITRSNAGYDDRTRRLSAP